MTDDSRDNLPHAATIRQVADLLMLADETGTPCPPVRELLAAAGNDGAYSVRLEAGSLVMAGGVTAAIALGPGMNVRCEMQHLGSVGFSVTSKEAP